MDMPMIAKMQMKNQVSKNTEASSASEEIKVFTRSLIEWSIPSDLRGLKILKALNPVMFWRLGRNRKRPATATKKSIQFQGSLR